MEVLYKVQDIASNLLWRQYEKIMTRLYGEVTHWTKPGFDLEETTRSSIEPYIEVGGPTEYPPWQVFDRIERSRRKIFVSDILPQDNGSQAPTQKLVDFYADGRCLPFKDYSIGMVFASCLPRVCTGDKSLRANILKESARVLVKGGLVIWRGSFLEDIKAAQNFGLYIAEYEWEMAKPVIAEMEKANPQWKTLEPEEISVLLCSSALSVRHWLKRRLLFLFHNFSEQDGEVLPSGKDCPYNIVFQKV